MSIDANHSHIAAGKVVCPFAGVPALRKRLSPLQSTGIQREVQGILEEFDASGKKTLILAPAETLASHGEVDRYSKLIYKRLFTAAGLMPGGKKEQLDWVMNYEDNLEPWVTIASAGVILPGSGYNMFTFFSPYFDPRHPRYMPAAMGLLTPLKEFESAEARQPGISEDIGRMALARAILSMLDPQTSVSAEEIASEMDLWKPLVIEAEGVFDDREDPGFPRTDLNRLHQLLVVRAQVSLQVGMVFEQFEGCFRARLARIPGVPILRRMMKEHPDLNLVDIAHALFTNHAPLYPKPLPQFGKKR